MSNPTELPDLDRLLSRAEMIAKWLETATMRQSAADVQALIALARRAQPESEVIPGKHAVFPINLLGNPMREYNHGKWESAIWPSNQTEGEAPQAEPNEFEAAIQDCALILDLPKGAGATEVCRAVNRLATAAQHAESGAPSHETIVREGGDLVCTACGTSAPGTPEAPADKHLPGWERGIATVTLNGHQLREALEFINPDGDDDEDQRDNELTFGIVQHKDDDGNAATGLCCWNDDSDGVLPLDSEPRAAQLDGGQEGALTRCAAGRDGECGHKACPQLRDNEPAKSGRHCPLDQEGSESNG